MNTGNELNQMLDVLNNELELLEKQLGSDERFSIIGKMINMSRVYSSYMTMKLISEELKDTGRDSYELLEK